MVDIDKVNERLRQENQQMKNDLVKQKSKGPLNKKTCLIIALVLSIPVGIVVLAIMVAIFLPMYTDFKFKTKVAQPIQAVHARTNELTNYYMANEGTFLQLPVDIFKNNLDQVEGMTWTVRESDDRVEISWDFGDVPHCPAKKCNGVYCIDCRDGCRTAIVFQTPALGMNDNPEDIPCPVN